MKKALLLALLLIFLSSIANASVVRFPDSITLREMPEEVTLTVKNDYAVRQPLDIQFYIPVNYEFAGKPGWLEAKEQADIVVRFIPKAELTGLTYESTALVKIGPEVTERKIVMSFEKIVACPIGITHTLQEQADNGSIVYEIALDNPSVRTVGVELLAVEGMPAGWAYGVDYAKGQVNGRSHANRLLAITPASAFSGDVELKFECEGFGGITHAIEVEHTVPNPLAGFVSFADLPLPEFSLPEFELTGEFELILDVILVLAVIALFLMFIVRYLAR